MKVFCCGEGSYSCGAIAELPQFIICCLEAARPLSWLPSVCQPVICDNSVAAAAGDELWGWGRVWVDALGEQPGGRGSLGGGSRGVLFFAPQVEGIAEWHCHYQLGCPLLGSSWH